MRCTTSSPTSPCPPNDTNTLSSGINVPFRTIRFWGTVGTKKGTGLTRWKDLESCPPDGSGKGTGTGGIACHGCDGGHAANDPTNPCYTWGTLDNDIIDQMGFSGTTNPGAVLDFEITFGHCPAWACSAGDIGPPNLLNSDGSGTNQDWIDFITAFHKRYGPQCSSTLNVPPCGPGVVLYYETWNEASPPLSVDKCQKHGGGSFWGGTYAGLVRMAYDIRQVLVAVSDTTSKLGTNSFAAGGGTGEADDFTCLYTAVANTPSGGAQTEAGQVDASVWHGRAVDASVPENVQTILAANYPVWTKYVPGKPNWMTEGSWRPCDVSAGPVNCTAPDHDINIQAAYVARYLLLLASSTDSTGTTYHSDRTYWYQYDEQKCYGSLFAESGNFSTCFGGVSGEGPVISATAYTQIYDWISGGVFTNPCKLVSPFWTCILTEAGGGKTGQIVWPNDWPSITAGNCDSGGGSGSGRNFTAPSGYVDYRDLVGNTTSVTGGTTVVCLGIKPIMFETAPKP